MDETTKELMIQKILDFLKYEFGDLFDELIKLMRISNIVISGSTIINLLLGKSIDSSDIDFYYNIPYDYKYYTKKYYDSPKGTGMKTIYQDFKDYLALSKVNIEKKSSSYIRKNYDNFHNKLGHDEYYVIDDDECFNSIIIPVLPNDIIHLNENNDASNLTALDALLFKHYAPFICGSQQVYTTFYVRNYHHRISFNKRVIQVIVVNNINNIINSFDFDICKCHFYCDINGKFHLNTDFMSNDIKISKFSMMHDINQCRNRIEKYKSRGFSIIYEGPYKEKLEQIVNDKTISKVPDYLIKDESDIDGKVNIPIKQITEEYEVNIDFLTELYPLNIIKFYKTDAYSVYGTDSNVIQKFIDNSSPESQLYDYSCPLVIRKAMTKCKCSIKYKLDSISRSHITEIMVKPVNRNYIDQFDEIIIE